MVLVDEQGKWAWGHQCVVTRGEPKQNDGLYPGPPEIPFTMSVEFEQPLRIMSGQKLHRRKDEHDAIFG